MFVKLRALMLFFLVWMVALPAGAITLYRSSDMEIRTLTTEDGAVNDHPVDGVDPQALARLLASLRLAPGAEGEGAYLMSENAARELGTELAKALGRVNAKQDIQLAIFRDLEGTGAARRHATGIRLFVQGGRLNLLFGQTDVFLDSFREPYTKLPRPGSRTASAQQGGRLAEQSGLQPVNGRGDWLGYPLSEALGKSRSLRQQPSTAGAPAQRDTPVSPEPSAAQATAPTAPAAVEAESQTGDRWGELEAGLEALERLHGKGLISDQEYAASRAKLLRGAGL